MQNSFEKIEELAAHVKEYINNRISIIKLNTAEQTSRVASYLIAIAMALTFFLFFIIFSSIALAYVFAEWTGKLYWGFLIVAGIYLLLGIIIWAARVKLLQLPIMNALLRELFKDDESDEED
jgi:uncharacterized membrane protein YqjE